MARTAAETANILSLLYAESFSGKEIEMFRIEWPELRSLSGIPKLTDDYLADINRTLAVEEYALIPFDDFLVVVSQSDFSLVREVPPRILEQNLPDWESDVEIDDDSELAVDEEDE